MLNIGMLLDTNFFIHYGMPSEKQWKELLSFKTLTLLVVPPVKSELDKKKWNSSDKNKVKAEKAIKFFKDWFRHGDTFALYPSVMVESVRYHAINFEKKSLDSINMDDQILGYALHLKESMKFDKILILTYDFGLQERAKDFGIEYFELPSELIIPTESNPLEKELAEAKRELGKLKNRLPRLSLKFEGNDTKKIHEFKKIDKLTLNEIENLVEDIKVQYPIINNPLENNQIIHSNFLNLFIPSNEDIQKYNSDLEIFYSCYRDSIVELNDFEIKDGLTAELVIYLHNTGTAPANNVSINIHLNTPEKTTLIDGDDVSERPKYPQAPDKPQAMIEKMAAMSSLIDRNYFPPIHSYSSNDIVFNNVSDPIITPTNSFNVSFEVQKNQHHSNLALKKLYLTFETIDEVKNFEIDYEIICDEIPEPQKGKLHFIAKVVV